MYDFRYLMFQACNKTASSSVLRLISVIYTLDKHHLIIMT